MVISSRILTHRLLQKLRPARALSNEAQQFFSSVASTSTIKQTNRKNATEDADVKKAPDESEAALLGYRFIYPEFLPDPNSLYRNGLRERLERMDMLARRAKIAIPEFYVGSVLAVTYSETHAPGKENRFVGICIQRKGCGLRASCLLRNVVDSQGMEVLYDIYDPTIQKIECLRLEKRLDEDLLYLRDAPLEYSTFPFDMKPEILPEGTPVPLNEMKVPLNPPPWLQKYEIAGYKGLENFKVSERRAKRAEVTRKLRATAYEKYDLMKTYRSTIPQEDQTEIFAELRTELLQLEIEKSKIRRKQSMVHAKKIK